MAYTYDPYAQITNEKDPLKAAMQDRQFALARGRGLDEALQGELNQEGAALGFWGGALQGAYDPLLAGGGYTPEEREAILQQQQLAGLQMTPEEYESSFLSDDERAAWMGQPDKRSEWLNPWKEETIQGEGAGFRRGAVDDYATRMGESYDPNALRAQGEWYDALGKTASDYAANVRGSIDQDKLSLDPNFAAEYRMTPEEEQRIVTGAGITAGNRDKAAMAEAARRSRAAGIDPLGVAALRQRSARDTSANAADAMTQAKIAADRESAGRLRDIEGMRLDAGRGLAGLRMQAEQGISDAGYRAAMGSEQVRSQQEQDIADRGMQRAMEEGRARMGTEGDIARERLALQQQIAQRGNEAARDRDDIMSGRSRDVALNRQGAQQYVQGQRYNRGVDMSDRIAQRQTQVANARREDQREARGFLAGQQQMANQNKQAALGYRQNLYGTQGQLEQGATKTQADVDNANRSRPGLFEKISGAAIGGASAILGGGGISSLMGGAKKIATAGGTRADGGIVTEPTLAMIGEEGPEMIVPLGGNNRLRPQAMPSMALEPGEPPPFDTAPPFAKPKPAYSQQYRYGG